MLTVLSMLLILAAILFGIMNFTVLLFFYMSTKWGYTIEQSRTSFFNQHSVDYSVYPLMFAQTNGTLL